MFKRKLKNSYSEGERLKQRRVRRTVRNSLISAAVMIVLAGASGLLYTWIVGQDTNIQEVESVSTENQINDIFEPSKPAPDATIGAAVQAISTPVKPGDNASIKVHTNAGATCKIKVSYNNAAAIDSGLVPKVADKYGNVNWSWTVAKDAPDGKWPVQVDCANEGKSAMVIGNLVVKKK